MQFNSDLNKPAQEIRFSRKNIPNQQMDIFLDNKPIQKDTFIEHLGFILDKKFNLN